MKIDFLGRELQSPIIIGSGPSVYDGKSAVRLCECGAGAVVTKTIRMEPCTNVSPHMRAFGGKSLINCEGWSDIPLDIWSEREIPYAKEHGAVIIASIGLTYDEVIKSARVCEMAGADYIEVVSYDSKTMPDMVMAVKKIVNIPVIAKISPNSESWLKDALNCVKSGADALTCFDSMGPVAAINIDNASIKTGNKAAWLSGEAIKPFTIYKLLQLRKYTDIPIIGLGGLGDAKDAIEFMMAGCNVCGVVSAIIRKSPEYIKTIITDIDKWMQSNNYDSYENLTGIVREKTAKGWNIDREKCVGCRKCMGICCYGALSYDNGIVHNINKCRQCGLCIDECPFSCISL